MYDYYLGGNHNYSQDREAARLVLGAAPDLPLAALENREFVKRAVQFLVTEAHLSQFLDIGPGLPTQGNVHQVVRQYDTEARVAYVDNDPVVVAHGRSILDQLPGVDIIHGDLRQPEAILAHPELQKLIDFSRPVALCMSLVLHFITEAEDPYGIVARLRDALCPGSYLVLTHVTGDERDVGTIGQVTAVYHEATAPLVLRTRDMVTQLFDGFELVEPGLAFLSQWRPTAEYYADGGTRWAYAGVGRKPEVAGEHHCTRRTSRAGNHGFLEEPELRFLSVTKPNKPTRGGTTNMLTWKVWANDQDLVFEGTEEGARAFVVEHLTMTSDLVLESPDGDSYCYHDGGWMFLGASGFWGPNGAYRPQHQ